MPRTKFPASPKKHLRYLKSYRNADQMCKCPLSRADSEHRTAEPRAETPDSLPGSTPGLVSPGSVSTVVLEFQKGAQWCLKGPRASVALLSSALTCISCSTDYSDSILLREVDIFVLN